MFKNVSIWLRFGRQIVDKFELSTLSLESYVCKANNKIECEG